MWTEDSGVILIFIYYKCYMSLIKFCLSIYGVFILFWGYFFYLFTSKSNVNYAYFYVLFYLFFVTTLKYHSNKFLQLKPKDEVTLLSPGVLFWLILECFK